MEKKKTAILGATPNPSRYAYLATERLTEYNHPVVPLGIREGKIGENVIITDWPNEISGLDTLTMYVGPKRQPEYYDYILGLNPKRVIFNPGTENAELYSLLDEKGIAHEEACTLVLLGTDSY